MKDRAAKADITAAVLLDEDTLVLFGAIDQPLPADGVVLLDGTVEGRFTGGCWTDGEGEGWFLGAIQVDGLVHMRPSRIEILDADGKRLALPRLSNVRTNPAHLVTALKGNQPDALAAALDFACTLMPPNAAGETAPSDRRLRLLAGLAQEASRPDGFVEVLGRFRDGALMVQGWSRGFPCGERPVVVETEGLRLHACAAAAFHRADLPGDASGLLAVLDGSVAAPAAIRRIHYRAADGWRHLALFEQRTILGDGVATAHARDMLGGLQDDAARRAVTRAFARYNGVETVSRLDAPVRIGLDMALRVPGAGLFVCGWLLDPAGLVRAVTLKGPGLCARLDGEWTRSARRDVSDAFAGDPLFAGRLLPGRDAHGFTAFAAEPAGLPAAAEFHLELTLEEGVAFLPLPCQPPSSDALRRMLGAVNPDSPSIERIVATHLGPMLRAAGAAPRDPAAATLHPMGRTVKAPRVSVILPVTDGREDIDLNLARLANDPDFAEAELLVAAGGGAHERLAGMVRQAAAFYRLSVGFVAAPAAGDPFEAIAAALPHARAERVLLLSPSVLPTERGWLSALERAVRKPVAGNVATLPMEPVMVSPTLLYEDHSIRFAGIVAVAGPDGAVTYERRFAGYPRDWLKERDPAAVDAAAADCALLPRELLARALAGGGRYLGAGPKGLDLSLRVRAAGGACLWLPGVRLVAVDEKTPEDHDPRWRRMSALVDRWSFAENWPAAVVAA
ncbi:hypothetical protein [Azospirillum doebereinerae]|uniref:Glycosyltransferase n=1 Tax=Azospirillum doebereinerae TaxID=92933 RepID=A0A3S0V6Y8_9PROT|nr:hypothetical protein [Azospirillum doebereinerae]MCG5238835.1 hypothetical protein [Azospirillum doebereinerae]RUQ72141.1 hypothetical protein EJ913_11310 [Azospirillum doebereinerae]